MGLHFRDGFGLQAAAVGPHHDAADVCFVLGQGERVRELVEGGVCAGREAADGDVVGVAAVGGDFRGGEVQG